MSLQINKILIKIEKILIQKQNKQNTQFCSDLKHDLNQKICIKQPWNKLTAPAVCASERQDLPIQNRTGSVVNCYIHVHCNIIIIIIYNNNGMYDNY